MADYNLLNGLFASPTSSARRASSTSLTCQLGYTKRTWKISDEHWEEFMALVALSKKTQAEVINDLIAKAVEENTKEIFQYLKLFSKNKEK